MKNKTKRSKKQKKIKLITDKVININGLKLYKVGNSYWSPRTERKQLKENGLIVTTKKSSVSSVMIDAEGNPLIIIDVDLGTLEKFYKELKKDLPELKKINKSSKKIGSMLGCRHLSPDFTMVVHDNNRRRKKK